LDFFLNLTLGILALILTLLWVRKMFAANNRIHFEWATFVLGGFASTGAVYAMEKMGAQDASWHLPTITLGLSLLSTTLAIIVARRQPVTSLIDVESMKLKSFSLSIYGAPCWLVVSRRALDS